MTFPRGGTGAEAPLPVCPYDGRCYRKNPQHFLDHTHPLQYPAADSTSDAVGTRRPTPPSDVDGAAPPKRRRADTKGGAAAEARQRRCAGEQDSLAGGDDTTGVDSFDGSDSVPPPPSSSPSPLQADEGAMASPEQLQRFLMHPPRLGALVDTDAAADVARHTRSPLPLLQKSSWAGVADVLRRAYASMGFDTADVQCVLLSACALRPDSPPDAFPGWRLVGPFELAVAYAECCVAASASGSSDGEAQVQLRLAGLVHPADAEVGARRWRCARYRYDPPECQTVVLRVATSASPSDTAAAEAAAGTHLCYHRDDPTDVPGLLVRGTARAATFSVCNNQGSLAAFLYASYAERCDTALPSDGAAAIVAAMDNALGAMADAGVPGHAALRRACRLSCNAQTSTAARRGACVANTYSGLGICVPTHPTAGGGYRRPQIPSGVSYSNCLRDWEAAFVTAACGGDRDAAGVGVVPPHRAARHGDLAKAKSFSDRMSAILDDIYVSADVANDEGDCGASLELGLNSMSCILADVCVVPPPAPQHARAPGTRQSPQQTGATVDPVLWQTYRLLDCAYMLLRRPLYRHVLRCHLPALADANHPLALSLL
ncbi:Zinc-finger (CX5CX6HX5H) motif containing protein [Novymonas esmeraldas]|uniref:Zinc-finger (CX5CX6HX5H) motif containing protein n=1 Tax=Novymonas esmeraldas TaxID=1808958 RepID=A0AAW0EXA6_9TRYP